MRQNHDFRKTKGRKAVPNDTVTEQLALLGGTQAVQKPFTRYNPIGREEVDAARRVVESGVLSQFIGAWHEDFYGGPMVREFERMSATHFGAKHAITVNSCTS